MNESHWRSETLSLPPIPSIVPSSVEPLHYMDCQVVFEGTQCRSSRSSFAVLHAVYNREPCFCRTFCEAFNHWPFNQVSRFLEPKSPEEGQTFRGWLHSFSFHCDSDVQHHFTWGSHIVAKSWRISASYLAIFSRIFSSADFAVSSI